MLPAASTNTPEGRSSWAVLAGILSRCSLRRLFQRRFEYRGAGDDFPNGRIAEIGDEDIAGAIYEYGARQAQVGAEGGAASPP